MKMINKKLIQMKIKVNYLEKKMKMKMKEKIKMKMIKKISQIHF